MSTFAGMIPAFMHVFWMCLPVHWSGLRQLHADERGGEFGASLSFGAFSDAEYSQLRPLSAAGGRVQECPADAGLGTDAFAGDPDQGVAAPQRMWWGSARDVGCEEQSCRAQVGRGAPAVPVVCAQQGAPSFGSLSADDSRLPVCRRALHRPRDGLLSPRRGGLSFCTRRGG